MKHVVVETFKIRVLDAVLTFNEGTIANASVLKELSIEHGKNKKTHWERE